MPDITLSFSFISRNPDGELENHDIYAIRRAVARAMEFSEFGRVLELQDDKFANIFARPVIDEYNRNHELYISYLFPFPPLHGNIAFLIMQGFPQIQDTIDRHIIFKAFIDYSN